jgi:hypothetical protein
VDLTEVQEITAFSSIFWDASMAMRATRRSSEFA